MVMVLHDAFRNRQRASLQSRQATEMIANFSLYSTRFRATTGLHASDNFSKYRNLFRNSVSHERLSNVGVAICRGICVSRHKREESRGPWSQSCPAC